MIATRKWRRLEIGENVEKIHFLKELEDASEIIVTQVLANRLREMKEREDKWIKEHARTSTAMTSGVAYFTHTVMGSGSY